jgi:hypothetical protein
MTAEIIPLNAARPAGRPPCQVGDQVLVCINGGHRLWCAFPVAFVDDDGVVLAVETKVGRIVGVDRINAAPEVYAFAARDHDPDGFAALRWQGWPDPGPALFAFARIGVVAAS